MKMSFWLTLSLTLAVLFCSCGFNGASSEDLRMSSNSINLERIGIIDSVTVDLTINGVKQHHRYLATDEKDSMIGWNIKYGSSQSIKDSDVAWYQGNPVGIQVDSFITGNSPVGTGLILMPTISKPPVLYFFTDSSMFSSPIYVISKYTTDKVVTLTIKNDGINAADSIMTNFTNEDSIKIPIKFQGVAGNNYAVNVVVIDQLGHTLQFPINVIAVTYLGSQSTCLDSRDQQQYSCRRVGNQTWMMQNINFKPDTGLSWCYNNADSNCTKYGRMYDWATTMGVSKKYDYTDLGGCQNCQGVCPIGWHIPTQYEWGALTGYVGSDSIAAKYLKAKSGWNYSVIDSTLKNFGFNALPTGNNSGVGFGSVADWWTSSESHAYGADGSILSLGVVMRMRDSSSAVTKYGLDRGVGLPVRCIMGTITLPRSEL